MSDGGVEPPRHALELPSVYLDTSVPSYLTRRRARALPVARNQLITCLLWNAHRTRFSLFISPRVVSEAARGNRDEVRRRTEILAPLRVLKVKDETERLAELIMLKIGLPAHVGADAEHVAIAATNRIDFLVTWNCKHLANPRIIPKVARVCQRAGFRSPEICTPEVLLRKVVYGRAAPGKPGSSRSLDA